MNTAILSTKTRELSQSVRQELALLHEQRREHRTECGNAAQYQHEIDDGQGQDGIHARFR